MYRKVVHPCVLITLQCRWRVFFRNPYYLGTMAWARSGCQYTCAVLLIVTKRPAPPVLHTFTCTHPGLLQPRWMLHTLTSNWRHHGVHTPRSLVTAKSVFFCFFVIKVFFYISIRVTEYTLSWLNLTRGRVWNHNLWIMKRTFPPPPPPFSDALPTDHGRACAAPTTSHQVKREKHW